MIRSLVGQASSGDDIVLDFFAGSGTTAQAVLECNVSDGQEGKRRFILISNFEATNDDPDKNVCRNVCSKRVTNVIEGYLLIEAPTGSGKTLIAGTMVGKFSHLEDVVWFWFAPPKGVVGPDGGVFA